MNKSFLVVTSGTNLGGAELNTLRIIEFLNKHNAQVHLLTESKGDLYQEFEKVTQSQLVTPFPYPSKLASWIHYFSFKNRLKSYISTIDGPLTIIACDYHPLWAATLISNNIIALWQGEYTFGNDHCIQKWIRYGANNATKRVVSNPITADIQKFQPAFQVNTLDPYIPTDTFDPSTVDRAKVRHSLGLKDTDRVAITTGQIHPNKGQPWLIEHFISTPELYNHWKLIIAGPYRHNDKRDWDDLLAQDTQKRILPLGMRKDIPELLAASDLAIFPGTANESFGMAPIEAALMDTPILILKSGAIAYNFKDYPGMFDIENRDLLIPYWANMDPASLLQLQNKLPNFSEHLNPSCWEQNAREVFFQ